MTWGMHVKKVREMTARPQGVSLREAADAINRPLNVTSVYVVKLVKDGEAFKAGVHGEYRYFKDKALAEQHDAKAKAEHAIYMAEAKKRKNAKRAEAERKRRAAIRQAKGLPPYDPTPKPPKPKAPAKLRQTKDWTPQESVKATVIWPENVKVHVLPTGRDTRFSFDPPPGWVGQISKDWLDRRHSGV